MRATLLEYRLRLPLHLIIFIIGFWRWESWVGLTTKSTWLVLSALFARQGWLSFQMATIATLSLALVFTALGAWFRVWGTAYVGAAIVSSPSMRGTELLMDGPYRHTRNPLYLGTLLHTIGLALLMPPAGAIFTIAAVWILQVRLALAEEPFLGSRFGQVYADYRAKVPQFLPSPRSLVPPSGHQPQWFQAILGESYFVGVVITLAAFGRAFNAQPLFQGTLISLRIAIVVNALLPRPAADRVSQAVV